MTLSVARSATRAMTYIILKILGCAIFKYIWFLVSAVLWFQMYVLWIYDFSYIICEIKTTNKNQQSASKLTHHPPPTIDNPYVPSSRHFFGHHILPSLQPYSAVSWQVLHPLVTALDDLLHIIFWLPPIPHTVPAVFYNIDHTSCSLCMYVSYSWKEFGVVWWPTRPPSSSKHVGLEGIYTLWWV